MAYRKLAGDRLYADVYDNKDPLFYYFTAAQVLCGPLLQYLAETSLILATGYLVAATARRFQPDMSLSGFTVCWLAAAYIFTGWSWGPGMPGTPGTFLAQTAIAAIVFEMSVVAGIALTATLFTNIIFFPPAAWFVLLFCVLRRDGKQGRTRRLLLVFSGAAAAAAAVALLLLLNGEWGPYLAMLRRNLEYAHENWQPRGGGLQTAWNHLAATVKFGKVALPAWCLSAVLLLIYGRRSEPGSPYWSASMAGASLFLLLLVESLGIVFLEQHLGPWRLLVFAALALAVPNLLALERKWVAIPLLGLAGLSLLPLSWSEKPFNDPFKFAVRLRFLEELSPETRLLRTMARDDRVSYARIGTNNDDHHARGTEHYRLACPDFQQYEIEPMERLQATVRCAGSAEYVIIDLPAHIRTIEDLTWLPPYSRIDELDARWQAYLRLVDQAFSHGYTCVAAGPELRVCHKIGLNGAA